VTDRSASLTVQRQVSLVEILDRALGAGVVLSGDLTISLADVDLVCLDLQLLLGSVGTIRNGHGDAIDTETSPVGLREEDAR
jgi:hypothetical protein